MSNHFPPLPSGLGLKSVTYVMNFGTGTLSVIPELQFSGVTTFLYGALSSLGNPGGVQFTFVNSGEAGGFDQDAAEAALAQLAGCVFQLISAVTGQPVSSLEQNFSVERQWLWTDMLGNQATYTDQMPTAPAS